MLLDVNLLINVLPVLMIIGIAFYAFYRMMKSKAVIINADGTYVELFTSSKQRRIDRGKEEGIYNVRPEAFVKKLVLGILPISRIYFMYGCPEPISFHSGKAVYSPDDLKLPVYGVFECPDCKGRILKIVDRVASPLLRTLLFEKRTEVLGKPEKPKINMKHIIYLAVVIGVIIIIAALLSSYRVPVGENVAAMVL